MDIFSHLGEARRSCKWRAGCAVAAAAVAALPMSLDIFGPLASMAVSGDGYCLLITCWLGDDKSTNSVALGLCGCLRRWILSFDRLLARR